MKQHEKLLTHNLPEKESLPNISLYMDQLLEILEQNLTVMKRTPDETVFTKTMINNYVKSGVISPPVKKKYAHESILELLMVYHLKQVLSISDTKTLIDQMKITGLDGSYQYFSRKLSSLMADMPSDIHQIDEMTEADRTTYILDLLIESSLKKQLAEMLIDQYHLNESE